MMALAMQAVGDNKAARRFIIVLALLGAALFYGDGVITPAMSIMGAVEGLKVAAPAFEQYVVPITLVVVIGLFAFQRSGTAKVGAVFGPVMVLWFVVLGALGLAEIHEYPTILKSLNPWRWRSAVLHGASAGVLPRARHRGAGDHRRGSGVCRHGPLRDAVRSASPGTGSCFRA